MSEQEDNGLGKLPLESLISMVDEFTVPPSNPKNLAQVQIDLYKVSREFACNKIKTDYKLTDQEIEAELRKYREAKK